jgi:hypothetical protein
MALLYANFTDSTVNYGNHIIETATRQVLKSYLDKLKIIEYDSFGNEIPNGKFDGLLIPGCTMITPGQNKSLDRLGSLDYDSFCFAGSLWYPNSKKSFLIKKRIFTFWENSATPDLSIVKNLKGIIGCRDIFTYNFLIKNGMNALYTGCPTLFLEKQGIEDHDYVLFSFGRHDFHKQVYYGKRLAKKHFVIGIVHEIKDAEIAKSAGWDLPLIDYFGDIDLYLSYFKNARFVVSGRLHGILPALAYGKKSFYFGTNDSRTTILHHLGIKIHKYSEIPDFIKKSSTIKNPSIIDFFQDNMKIVAESIFESLDK